MLTVLLNYILYYRFLLLSPPDTLFRQHRPIAPPGGDREQL
jgi:hypothetical protein